MKRCKVGTRRVGKSCRSKGKKKGAKEVKIIYIPGRKVPKAQAAKDEAYLRKHGKKSWRLYGLSGTPEEHSFKGKAALRDAMKHEHAATQAAQSGNCTSAAKHAGQMQFAMGQADAHGVLPNAAYVRMLHVGDKAVNAACSILPPTSRTQPSSKLKWRSRLLTPALLTTWISRTPVTMTVSGRLIM